MKPTDSGPAAPLVEALNGLPGVICVQVAALNDDGTGELITLAISGEPRECLEMLEWLAWLTSHTDGARMDLWAPPPGINGYGNLTVRLACEYSPQNLAKLITDCARHDGLIRAESPCVWCGRPCPVPNERPVPRPVCRDCAIEAGKANAAAPPCPTCGGRMLITGRVGPLLEFVCDCGASGTIPGDAPE